MKALENPATTVDDAKRLFLKLGACSSTLFYIVNREFGHPKEAEVRAAEVLAGGILRQGLQCGFLWGSAMGAGAESFRRYPDRSKAIEATMATTQHLMESFQGVTKTHDCRTITDCDWNSKLSMTKYFLTGRFTACFTLAGKWSPEAIQVAHKGLSHERNGQSYPSFNCACETVRKMGASDEEAVMVAGFAGGLGLSGNGCGALSAAMWMIALKEARKHPGNALYSNPEVKEKLEDFLAETDDKVLCREITGRGFSSTTEHSEFVMGGGCDKLIELLAKE